MSAPLPPDGLVAAITSQVKKRATLICSNPDCRARHSRKGQRYCGNCHALYQQSWRAAQKHRANETRARLEKLTNVIASEAKQSRATRDALDCFGASAPRNDVVSRAVRRASSAADRPRREG